MHRKLRRRVAGRFLGECLRKSSRVLLVLDDLLQLVERIEVVAHIETDEL